MRGETIMQKQNIRFGIIGCGMIADWHARAIKETSGAVLIGVTDLHEQTRISFARKNDVKAFGTENELLNNHDIDVVCICTPSGLHAVSTVNALRHGKHVVVEKPMGISLEQCEDILQASKSEKRKVSVISQYRFSDAVKHLERAICADLLGKIVMGRLSMKYHRSQEYYAQSNWKGTWKMDGGGALMNQGIHGIDLMQHLLGPVKAVSSFARTLSRKIEVEDTVCAILEYSSGAIGTIEGTTSVYPGYPRTLEINGDRGTIILEEDAVTEWTIEGQSQPADLILGRATNVGAYNPSAIGIEGHKKQIADMADAIRNDRQPVVDAHEGMKAVVIILAIYESSKTGKTVYL
jgi:predicted dehydrogenase